MATLTMKPKKETPAPEPEPTEPEPAKGLTPAEAFRKMDEQLHPKAPKA